MKKCYLCGQSIESKQAMDSGKIFDALEVDCPHCGCYRISGTVLALNNLGDEYKKAYAELLNKRTEAEQRKLYWVTTKGISAS